MGQKIDEAFFVVFGRFVYFYFSPLVPSKSRTCWNVIRKGDAVERDENL